MEAKEKAKGIPWYWLTFYNNSKEIDRFLLYWGIFGTLIVAPLALTFIAALVTGIILALSGREEAFPTIQIWCGGMMFGIFWVLSLYLFIGSFLAKRHFNKPKITAHEGVGKG